MRNLTVSQRMYLALTRAHLALQRKQKGLTTVEYAVAGALVAATLVAAFAALGNQVGNLVNTLTNAIGG